jgi:hypothetical protein
MKQKSSVDMDSIRLSSSMPATRSEESTGQVICAYRPSTEKLLEAIKALALKWV